MVGGADTAEGVRLEANGTQLGCESKVHEERPEASLTDIDGRVSGQCSLAQTCTRLHEGGVVNGYMSCCRRQTPSFVTCWLRTPLGQRWSNS
eukprot:8970667-Pyramimonas_sp.AAC.1